jgi:hypothetical protein
MSKRINVNPDHYKTAGRERPGDAVTQEIEKKEFSRQRTARSGARTLPGDRPKVKSAPQKKRRG